MPAAKGMAVRREIVNRREAGESLAQIGREVGVAYGTVRNVWRQYEEEGQLEPGYDRCRHTEVRKARAVYERAVEMKRAHPSWGAGLIRVELAEAVAGPDLPSKRTLQRWFRRGGVAASSPTATQK
jgi:transposase-like protein